MLLHVLVAVLHFQCQRNDFIGKFLKSSFTLQCCEMGICNKMESFDSVEDLNNTIISI